MNVTEILEKQRAFFASGATRNVAFRKRALLRLKAALAQHEEEIYKALEADLNKSKSESYLTELGIVLDEIGYHVKHVSRWAKNRRVRTPLAHFPAKSFRSPEPYGVALIMAPWNYPVQLCLSPLVGAISAGNCAVLKPSAYAPAVSALMAKIVGETFLPEYVAVVEGGRAQNQALLEERFDYIFFTGSVSVGKLVMEAAAKHLTPVSLELGGKSPVIVDESANIKVAARRIAFGKILNAGQTCVAPNYVLVEESVKEEFIAQFKKAVGEFFPNGDFGDMPHIISNKHFERLRGLLSGERVVFGGGFDPETRLMEPTLLTDVSPDSPVMSEEIFGPILPVISFKKLEDAIREINARPKPLALYLFTAKKEVEREVLGACSFGGGCINDTVIHIATPHMGFGGVGESGMGAYHGKQSFDTFSHTRSIVKKGFFLDLPMRYRPYSEKKDKLIRKFLK